MIDAVTAWAMGLTLGMRHALEPDHLAAVSTLMTSGQEPRPLRTAALGAFWGIGHTAALFAVGVALAALRTELPARLAEVFELGVSAMLIFLGARALARARREGVVGETGPHVHDGTAHSHVGPAAHVHLGRATLAARPLLVGVVHGLAGSGALTALAMANLDDGGARLVYLTCFGVGSVLGMSLLTGLLGVPLARLRPRATRLLGGAAGAVSLVLGCIWGWRFLQGWLA